MSKAVGCLAALVVVAIILAVMVGGSYNRLVGLSQGVDAQWAQVESVYQRRADLIPNLVATVQGAANFEKSTLEAITQARASVGQMQGPNARDLPSDPAAFARWQAAQAPKVNFDFGGSPAPGPASPGAPAVTFSPSPSARP
jgi:LemA protein